jgi:tripartite-type tricarboxylate transporter receptor subunit TctC
MSKRKTDFVGFFATAMLVVTAIIAPAFAQDYPTKQVVKLIVPFAAGSASDTIGRIMVDEYTKAMGGTFIVENRPGAGGLVGTAEAVRAPADGYTLVLTSNSTHALAPWLYKTVPYDAVKNFQHIARWVEVPFVLVVSPNFPANTFREFIDYAKKNPDKLAFGYGTSSSQLSVELLNQMADIKTLPVPYKSHPNAVTDLIAGQTQFMILDMAAAIAQINGNNLKAIALTTKKRSEFLPNLPTIAESGYPDYTYATWLGLAAPAGTPSAIVEKLSAETLKILAKPDVQKRFAVHATTVAPNTVKEQEELVSTGLEFWRQRIQSMKIELQ